MIGGRIAQVAPGRRKPAMMPPLPNHFPDPPSRWGWVMVLIALTAGHLRQLVVPEAAGQTDFARRGDVQPRARCHDHKFDPIPRQDYYPLQAVFAGIDKAERPFNSDPRTATQRKQLLRRKAQVQVLWTTTASTRA